MHINIRLTEDKANVLMLALEAFAEMLSGEPDADVDHETTALMLYEEIFDKTRYAKWEECLGDDFVGQGI
jgi:hypothetical protein